MSYKAVHYYLLLLALLPMRLYSQQDAQYSQYMFNSLVINPAYAGYKEAVNVSILHRDQWTGFDGAPKTQSLIVDGAFFNDKVGLGLSIVNDRVGLQDQTSAYANYSYRLKVGNNDARLAFGLAAGVAQYTLNGDDALLESNDDPNLIGSRQSYFAPDAKFGIHYSNDKLYAGASVTNLFSNSINYSQVTKNLIVSQSRHYFLTAGYLVDLNENIKFKPSFLLRDDSRGPTNLDVNSFFLVKEALWLGISYRTGLDIWGRNDTGGNSFQQNALVGAVEMFVSKKFRIGYSYDYSLSQLHNYSNGSHEISLGLVINTNKKSNVLQTPRYF